MPEYTQIKAKIEEGIGSIVFDRFDRRNALSLELFRDLGNCLEDWKTNDDVAVVLITGGEDIFSAGLDLSLQADFTPASRAEYGDVCLWAYGLVLEYPKPTIAAVGGAALGGGLDIAVFCDIRIGAPNATLGWPQIKFGLTPYFSPLWKIVGLSQAKLLSFSGDRIDAAEALRIGLFDRMAPAGEVVATATQLARSIASTTTASAKNNKEIALRAPAMDPVGALVYETMAYREVIWHEDVVARVSTGLSKLRK